MTHGAPNFSGTPVSTMQNYYKHEREGIKKRVSSIKFVVSYIF